MMAAHRLPPCENSFPILLVQGPPGPRGEVSQRKGTNPYPDEPERRVTNFRGHAPHLSVFPLPQLKQEPGSGNFFTLADRGIPWRQGRRDSMQAGPAREGPISLDFKSSPAEALKGFVVRDALDLNEVAAAVAVARVEQEVDDIGLIGKQ